MSDQPKPTLIPGDTASIAAYTDWCERQRVECLKTGHPWRRLSDDEAYPAMSGRVCTRCDLTDLRWFSKLPSTAYEQGWHAVVGFAAYCNPHPEGTVEHAEYARGYDDGGEYVSAYG